MGRLAELPPISRLLLAEVALPGTHPRAREGTCSVFAFAVHHRDGVVLVDTGVGTGNPWIDQYYSPTVYGLVETLNAAAIDERDVVAVVNTHLHFDHCGQNHVLAGRPFYVQKAELDAAREPAFTVAEWADIPAADRRVVDGDTTIADGVSLLATPGHTPGHQSIVVESDDCTAVIAGQCAYCAREFAADEVPASDMHNAGWHDVGVQSLARVRALDAVSVYFSHDAVTYAR